MSSNSNGPPLSHRSLPLALLRTREAVMERFRPMLAAHDLTEQQWRVLRVVGEKEAVEAGLLAELACVLPPSLSRITKSLVANGLLTAGTDLNDGRKSVLRLTAQGRHLLVSAAPESIAVYGQIEALFGADALQKLVDDLQRLQNVLRRL